LRIMGLDLGNKTIGIAVSDPLAITAQAVKVIRRSGQEMEELSSFIREYEVSRIVLGYPRNMNGTLGERARLSEEFAEKLKEHFALPVILWDERLSTAGARRTLLEADLSRAKRKKVIDKIAAVLILQGYLDSLQGGI
jgi:putative Holliday junction resolvase